MQSGVMMAMSERAEFEGVSGGMGLGGWSEALKPLRLQETWPFGWSQTMKS